MRLEGRELDAAVHERVFGRRAEWAVPSAEFTFPFDPDTRMRIPDYSTDIAAAWWVVQEMTRRGYVASIDVAFAKGEQFDPEKGAPRIVPEGVAWADVGFGRDEQQVHRNLHRFIDVPVPTAICRAALLAVCGFGEENSHAQ